MICRQCQADYSPLLPGCPHCYQKNGANRIPSDGTRRLPDLSGAPTRHLVALNSCPHCRFLLFPTDAVCPSCGLSVRGGAQILSMETPHRQASGETWRKTAIGLAIGGVTVLLLVVLVTLFRHL